MPSLPSVFSFLLMMIMICNALNEINEINDVNANNALNLFNTINDDFFFSKFPIKNVLEDTSNLKVSIFLKKCPNYFPSVKPKYEMWTNGRKWVSIDFRLY